LQTFGTFSLEGGGTQQGGGGGSPGKKKMLSRLGNVDGQVAGNQTKLGTGPRGTYELGKK